MKIYSYNEETKQYIEGDQETLYEKLEKLITDFFQEIGYGYYFKVTIYKKSNEAGILFQQHITSEKMSTKDIEESVNEMIKYIKYILSTNQTTIVQTEFETPDHQWGSNFIETKHSKYDFLNNEKFEEYKAEGFDILITDFN